MKRMYSGANMFIWTLTETVQAQPAVARLPHFVGGELTARPCRTCAVRTANDSIAATDDKLHHCETPVCRLRLCCNQVALLKSCEYCFVLAARRCGTGIASWGPWRSPKLKITSESESLLVFLIVREIHSILSTESHALVIAYPELYCKAPSRITPQSFKDLDAQQHNALWYPCRQCNAPKTPSKRKTCSNDRWPCHWPEPPALQQTSEP